jgi:uncharacterized membrane protein YdjX (TVP38/TMEM64 family)
MAGGSVHDRNLRILYSFWLPNDTIEFGGWIPVWGTVVAITGALIGSTICYYWALTLVQEWAAKQLDSKKIFKAIEMAVQNEAMKFIILAHLCPLFSTTILNYLFATMGVNFIKFFVGTAIGFVPLTFMYCYIGSISASLVSAFQGDEAGTWKIFVILVFAVVSLVLLILVLGWIGKREYNRILKQYEEQENKTKEAESLLSQKGSPDTVVIHA